MLVRLPCALAVVVLVLATSPLAHAGGERSPMVGGAVIASQTTDEAEVAGLSLEVALWWNRIGLALEGSRQWDVATVAFEAWHERLVLWFLYIAPAYRRRGVGRALLERVEAHGREVGATHVWLETSSVNVPGVTAYERLGYSLVGVDRLYYGSYMPDEAAIYLAKPLR